jgi:hypothetical protein
MPETNVRLLGQGIPGEFETTNDIVHRAPKFPGAQHEMVRKIFFTCVISSVTVPSISIGENLRRPATPAQTRRTAPDQNELSLKGRYGRSGTEH